MSSADKEGKRTIRGKTHKRNNSSSSVNSTDMNNGSPTLSNSNAEANSAAVDKAFQGKINPEEYKNFIRQWIMGENSKTAATSLVSISTHSIDFNSEISNSLLPVFDFEEKTKFSARATIKLTNQSKEKIYYELIWFDNPKFYLEATPAAECIRPNSSIEVTLDVRVFCTTRVYQMIQIHLNKTKKKGGIFGKKTEVDVGFLWLVLKFQSEASTSLDIDELKLQEEIGRGAYGVVYRAFYRDDEVAVKELNLERLVDDEIILVKREISNMSKLKSKYIVQYIGATLCKGMKLCVVMEFIKNGTLTKFLESRPFTTTFKTKLCLDIAKGMAVLHSNHVGHRDLKSDNVLVFTHNEDAPLNLKITDFGQSKAQVNPKGESNYANYESFNVVQKKQEIRSSKGVGTLIYQAPEILEGSSSFNDQAIDVYSFGVLMWQTFTQKEPYSNPPYCEWQGRQIADFVRSGKRLDVPKDIPRELSALIQACWDQNPDHRPQFSATIVPCLTQIYDKLVKETPPLGQQPIAVAPSSLSQTTVLPSLPKQQPMTTNNSFSSSSSFYPVNGGSGGIMPTIPVVNVGVPSPPGDLVAIGWCGEISREDAIKKLQSYPRGAFLVRWSSKQKCFVVSYNSPVGTVKHIDSIWLKDNRVEVLRADNSRPIFNTMLEYISTLREQEKILTDPIRIQLPTPPNADDIYDKPF